MKKRILALAVCVLLVAAVAIGLVACNNNADEPEEIEMPAYAGIVDDGFGSNLQAPANFKFGMICLHGEESTYDLNFINAAKQAVQSLGLSVENNLVIKTGIPETEACETAARDLVNQGCKVIFADSFGHEPYIAKVAQENPTVQFCHGTGTTAHTAGIANFHNAFASIYEGRYLAGVAAGLKLKEMGYGEGGSKGNAPKVGYVGAYTYAEVISGYTSWFLGVRSIIPGATMEVQFTGSWFDIAGEKSAANLLIQRGCVLISQHADSMGAPSACEERNIPNVSYNGSTFESCPETFLVSSRIDWKPYFRYIIAKTVKGEEIAADWCGSLKTGSVALTNLGAAVADGTKEYLIEVRDKLAKGEIKVFDTSKFTVNGETLESHMADVNTDAAFTGDTEAVSGGYFHESEYRSAPYFDVKIDGITLLKTMG